MISELDLRKLQKKIRYKIFRRTRIAIPKVPPEFRTVRKQSKRWKPRKKCPSFEDSINPFGNLYSSHRIKGRKREKPNVKTYKQPKYREPSAHTVDLADIEISPSSAHPDPEGGFLGRRPRN